MTKNLTAELARLNEFNAKWHKDPIECWDVCPDAITLANQLHALLVEAEGALNEAVQSHDNLYMAHFNDANGCEHDLAIMPARQALTKLHAAGIGGE